MMWCDIHCVYDMIWYDMKQSPLHQSFNNNYYTIWYNVHFFIDSINNFERSIVVLKNELLYWSLNCNIPLWTVVLIAEFLNWLLNCNIEQWIVILNYELFYWSLNCNIEHRLVELIKKLLYWSLNCNIEQCIVKWIA